MNDLAYIANILEQTTNETQLYEIRGRVLEVVGTLIKAIVPRVKLGELCTLRNPGEQRVIQAEVVGLSRQHALLTPMGEMIGISTNTEVIPSGHSHRIPVGFHLLGQVLDSMGTPLDKRNNEPLLSSKYYPIYADPPNPITRKLIDRPLPLGIRVLDGLLTCGEGQRMGIFAAAGGGKSTLLSTLVKGAEVDVTVLALIGERGREVREFIEHNLGEEGMRKSVLVVATSDRPSIERAKAAYVATAIAEYFRDQGKKVLLLMDSVTRFARAQREIGLAAGEPPTRRGFPPSVFAELPKLMERAGQSDKGSITALYTILVEGDDMTEPVADESRSILDGHIILSRKLAAAGHYPAIDVLASVSRVMNNIVDREHIQAAEKIRELLAKYQEIELLVRVGEYKEGADAKADESLAKIDVINNFLKQRTDEFEGLENTVEQMKQLA